MGCVRAMIFMPKFNLFDVEEAELRSMFPLFVHFSSQLSSIACGNLSNLALLQHGVNRYMPKELKLFTINPVTTFPRFTRRAATRVIFDKLSRVALRKEKSTTNLCLCCYQFMLPLR